MAARFGFSADWVDNTNKGQFMSEPVPLQQWYDAPFRFVLPFRATVSLGCLEIHFEKQSYSLLLRRSPFR